MWATIRAAGALLLLVQGVGCVHADVLVSGHRLQREVTELRARGSAEVDGRGVTLDDQVVARLDSGPKELTVAALIQGCPDQPSFVMPTDRASLDCLLRRSDDIVLGEEIDWGASAALWTGAGLFVGAIGLVVGVLLQADAADSRCDLDCP